MSGALLTRRVDLGAVLAVVLAAGLLLRFVPDEAQLVLSVTLGVGALVVWIAWQDLKAFTISDGATAAIAVLALAYRWSTALLDGDDAMRALLSIGVDVLLTGGLLLAFREIYYRRRGFDGLGLGDVKLAAAGGLLVGAVAFAWALLAASLAGLSIVALRRLASRPVLSSDKLASDKLAFGAVLAPALWAVWVAQQAPLLLSLMER